MTYNLPRNSFETLHQVKDALSESIKPLPKQSLIESEELLGEDLFLYDQTTGAVHTLNSGAAMVWLLCDGSHDIGEITSKIASTSGIGCEQVLPQVKEAVSQFSDLGLLET